MTGQCILDIRWGAILYNNLKGYDKITKRIAYSIRVNIPFIYKPDYRNIITKLGAIICCQVSLPFLLIE